MTPPPPAASAAPRLAGRRTAPGRSLRRGPSIPRRVSGPVRGAAATRLPRGVALPRPGDLRLPRPSAQPLLDAAARAAAMLRGRGLIVLLAGALLGLVFLQVSLLKLHTQITQNVERAAALERDNAVKRTMVSQLDAGNRIQDAAGKLGMVLPGAGAVCYLDARKPGACSGGDPAAAASAVDPVVEAADAAAAPAAADPAVQPAADPVQAQQPVSAEPQPGAQTAPQAAQPTQAPAEQPAPAQDAAPASQAPAPVSAPIDQTTATGGIAAGTGQ